jgi:hypothetical protein
MIMSDDEFKELKQLVAELNSNTKQILFYHKSHFSSSLYSKDFLNDENKKLLTIDYDQSNQKVNNFSKKNHNNNNNINNKKNKFSPIKILKQCFFLN